MVARNTVSEGKAVPRSDTGPRVGSAMSEPWLDKRQLAAHLGFSARWVDYRVSEGMPSHTFGKRRRFRISEVERWLEDSP